MATKQKTAQRGSASSNGKHNGRPAEPVASEKERGGSAEASVDSEPSRGRPAFTDDVAEACMSLQRLGRQHAAIVKTEVKLTNRIVAVVASMLGYHAGMDEKERKKRHQFARTVVSRVLSGKEPPPIDADPQTVTYIVRLVMSTRLSLREGFRVHRRDIETDMCALASRLPVYEWAIAIRGSGALNLAKVIAECGDLRGYPNHRMVWRRMGCAPFEKAGVSRMGSSWRGKKGLSAEDWMQFGYSPRRRSIAYMVAQSLVLQNQEPETKEPLHYRRLFLEAKADAAEKHPDWTKGHVDAHGHLLCAKAFLRDLWRRWRDWSRMDI